MVLIALAAIAVVVVVGNIARQRSAGREELQDGAAARARRARVRQLRGVHEDDAADGADDQSDAR